MEIANQNMVPELVDSNPSLAYIGDVYQRKGEVNKKNLFDIFQYSNQYTDFDRFFDTLFLDFEKFQQVHQQHEQKKQKQFHEFSKKSKQSLINFFKCVKKFKMDILKNQKVKFVLDLNYPNFLNDFKIIPDLKLNFETIPGRNPSTWPHKLNEFINNLKNLPFYTFFQQPIKLHSSYIKNYKNKQKDLIKKIKNENIQDKDFQYFSQVIQAHFLSSILKGSFYRIMTLIQTLNNISSNLDDKKNKILTQQIKDNIKCLIKEIIYDVDQQQLDFKPMFSQINSKFSILDMKIQDFTINDYAIATDGVYLYEAVNLNQMLLLKKIGTGKQGSKPGVVYNKNTIKSCVKEEFTMIYLKKNLYIPDDNNPGSINIICPDTLQLTGNINLSLQNFFQNPFLAQYNKNFQIFTDGKNLFTVQLKLKKEEIDITKEDNEQKNKEKTDMEKVKKDTDKEEIKIKKDNKSHEKKKKYKKIAKQEKIVQKKTNEINLDNKKEDNIKQPQNLQIEKQDNIKQPQNLQIEKQDTFQQNLLKKETIIEVNKTPENLIKKDINNKLRRSRQGFYQRLMAPSQNNQKPFEDQFKDSICGFMLNSESSKDNDDNIQIYKYIEERMKKEEKLQNKRVQRMQEKHRKLREKMKEFECGEFARNKLDNEIFKELDEDLKRDEFMNLRSINIIKNLFKNQVMNDVDSEKDSNLQTLTRQESDFDNKSVYTRFLLEKELEKLHQGGLHRVRNTRLIKKELPKEQVQKNEKFLYKICFYVLKFDIKKNENYYTEEQKEEFRKNPDIQELYESFDELFTYEECAHSYFKNDKDLEIAARYLIQKGQRQNGIFDINPFEEILIYQTFSQNINFEQQQPVKGFSVIPNSILVPQDITNGNWFIKGNKLLKSTGQLFSLDQRDQIEILPENVDKKGSNIFSERRNSKLHKILSNENLDPEYVDVLYQQLLNDTEDYQLNSIPLIRNVTQDESNKTKKIITTFLKTYPQSFFIKNPLTQVCYDNYNNQFLTVNLFKIPKTSYNFVKQTIQYHNDNYWESKQLKSLIPMSKEKLKNPFLFYLEILKSKNLNDLLMSIMEFILWVNIQKNKCQKRLNKWELIYKQKISKLSNDDKKKKQNYQSKIKKLKERRLKKKKEHQYISHLDNENINFEEIKYVRYLCIKGNIKNFQILQQLKDSFKDNNSIIKSYEKLFFYNLNFCHRKKNFSEFKNSIQNNINKKMNPSIIWIISIDYNLFKQILLQTLKENQDLFYNFLEEIFSKVSSYLNLFSQNEKILLIPTDQNDLQLNSQQIETCELNEIKSKLKKLLQEEKDFIQNIFDISDQYDIKKKINLYKICRKLIEIELFFSNNIDSQQSENLFFLILKQTKKLAENLKQQDYQEQIEEELTNYMNYISLFIINIKIVNFKETSQILDQIFQILQQLKPRYINTKKIQQNFFNKDYNPGISTSDIYIAETPHPIERGQVIQFRKIFKPKAIGFIVHFDKRCQDEENSDNLIISTDYSDEPTGNLSTLHNAILSKNITITFKKKEEKILYMLGNTLSAKFTSSLVAKQNIKSLNQWGYKIYIRPVYGTQQFKDNCFNNFNIQRSIDSMVLSFRFLLDCFLQGKGQNINNDQQQILQWSIFQKGLTSLKRDNFLQKLEDKYEVINQDSLTKNNIQSVLQESEAQSQTTLINDCISLGQIGEIDCQDIENLLSKDDNGVRKLIQYIKKQVMPPMILTMEKQRTYFSKEMQSYWDKVEDRILLCYIKHTNLLRLVNLMKNQDINFVLGQANIQDQLVQIGKKRNSVLRFMLQIKKTEKDFQDSIKLIFESIKEYCIENIVRPRIMKKIEDQEKKLQKKSLLGLNKKKVIRNLIQQKKKNKRKKSRQDTPSVSQDQQSIKKIVKDDTENYYLTKEDFNTIIKNNTFQKQIQSIVIDKFEHHEDMLEKIFIQKKMNYIKEKKVNFEAFIKKCLKYIENNLISLTKDKYKFEIKLGDPYQQAANIIQERCDLLLKIENENKSEVKEEFELENLTMVKEKSVRVNTKEEQIPTETFLPIGVKRSLTSDSHTKKMHKKKQEKSDWIEKYQKWKKNMTNRKENLKSENCSPSFAVTEFLTYKNPINIQNLQNLFLQNTHRATLRVIGFQYYNKIWDFVQQSPLEQFVNNLASSSYKNLNLFQGIELSNQDFKKSVQNESTNLIFKFIQKVLTYQDYLQKINPQIIALEQQKFQTKKQIVFESFIEDINNFLKNMLMMYCEIFTFVNNNLFSKGLSQILKDNKNKKIMSQFVKFNIEIGLIYFSIKFLSNYYKEIVTLSKNLFDISFSITKRLYNKDQNILENDILYEFIYKEIYLNIDKKIIKKVDQNDQMDMVHSKRLIFLLNMLYLKLNSNKKFNIVNKNSDDIKKALIIILNQSQIYTITQLSINCLILLNIHDNLQDKKLLEDLQFSYINIDKKILDKIQQKTIEMPEKQKLFDDNVTSISQPIFQNQKTVLENLVSDMGKLLNYNTDNKNQKNWKIFLHLETVETLIPLIRVFFYWEKIYPNFSKKLPNNMKEYREYRKKISKDQGSKPTQKNNISSIQKNNEIDTIKMKLKLNETLFQKSPLIDPIDIQKNIGWFFNVGDQFKDYRKKDEKLKEIILKQSQNKIDTKQLELFLTTLNDQIKLLQLPNQKELKIQREQIKLERQKDPFDDEYGYCLDLLFADYQNLEEVNKQIQIEKKEILKSKFKTIKGQTTKDFKNQLRIGKMQLKDKLLQKKTELLQQKGQILFAKKEKPKSQELKREYKQKVRRKKSEYIVEKRKQEEEFLETFRNLKILAEVTKTVCYIGSLMNFTGHSEIIINNQFFQQNQQKTKEFCSYFEALCSGSLQKIDGMSIIDQQILQNLKNYLIAINKTPRRKKFQYSLIRSNLSLQINMFNNLGKLKVKDQEFCKEANKNQSLIYNQFQGIAKSAKIRALKNFIYKLSSTNQNIMSVIQQKIQYYLTNEYKDEDKFERAGIFLLISDWNNQKILGEQFQDDKSKEKFQILANKLNTGKKQTLSAKFIEGQAIITSLKKAQDVNEEFYQQYFEFENCQDIITNYITNNISILNSSEFDFFKKFEFATVMNILKYLFTKNNWVLDQTFQKILDQNFVQCKNYYKEIHQKFIESCESIMDISFTKKFTVPQDIGKKIAQKFINKKKKVTFNNKEEQKKEQNQVMNTFIEKQSSHLAEMKTNQKKVSEYKMLKYWEKNVIPKIYNFVKGSLSNFEIKDFFEQMRIELRKENHSQASHIAYILCDQKLPNNCYIPGLNYDWNSLDLDEISIGQWVLIKIKDDNELYSPLLEEFHKVGIHQILAQVIQKDFNHSIVNVLVSDLSFSQSFNIWIPQQAIKQIKTCINYPSTYYEPQTLKIQFKSIFKKFCQVLSREISVRNFERQKNSEVKKQQDFEKLKKIAEFELKGHCLKRWISCNGNYLDTNQQQTNLNAIAQKLTEQNNQNDILDHIQEESTLIIDFFNNFYYECDLEKQLKDQQLKNFKALKGESTLSNLNVFKQDELINGLTVEFKKPSNLYKCSGLKIYSDKQGINMISHLSANQSEDNSDLQPLVFQDPNIYYTYYYNKEAVPAYISENQTTFTSLKVKVHAIPTSWNYLMWLFDVISTKAFEKKDVKFLKKTLVVFIEFFNKFKGPSVALKYVYELFTRILIKVKNSDLSKEKFEIFESFDIQKIIDDYNKRLSELQENDLVPNLVQQMTEFISVYQLLFQQLKIKDKKFTVPQNIQQVSQIFDMADFLHSNKNLNKNTIEQFRQMMQPNNLNKQILIIRNIPQLSVELLKDLILKRCTEQKMKILIPDFDIYIPLGDDDLSVGYIVILFDGWEVPGIEDLKQEEEEEEEEEQVQVERQWQCVRCTLLNPDVTAVCQVCEAPKPANPVYPNEIEEEKVEEEVSYFSFKNRLNEYKNQLLQDFNRITPDKRISIDSFEDNYDKLQSQHEFLEFLMIRIIDEKFQENLKLICKDIYKENSEYILQNLNLNNKDELYDHFQNLEPNDMFNLLFDFGYDYWLEKICPSKFNYKINLLDKKTVQIFQRFIVEDLEQDVKEIENFSPYNFRIEFKNKLKSISLDDNDFLKSLNYRESKQFYFNSMKLNCYTNYEFKTTLNAIYFLNQLITDNFKYVNILVSEQEDTKENSICLKFGALLFNVKDYFSSYFKNEFSQKILEHTAQLRDQTPRIIIERLTKEKQILSAKNDQQKQEEKNSSYMQGFKQLQKISPINLRPQKPKGSDPYICFEIIFKGEHVMGEGGPYRQFFADIVSELQEKDNDLKKLNLLIPTPNQVSESGDFKDKFTINPSLKTPYHLQLYEYLGILMGCAFRTETFLSLDLPTIFWKKMVNEQIVEKDIEELDLGVTQLIKFVRNSSDELFEDTVFENFTTFLSDKSVIELVPNGSQKKVDSKNRYDYIKKTIQTRLSEADVQIDSIRKGFIQIVPKVLLAVYNARDLEKRICGNKEVDFQLLKKNTRYSGGLKENSELIQNFWSVLFELSNKDKLLFVKFCWGQERLPSTLQSFANQSNRFMIKPAQYSGNQDGILPRADTCFFNFELPNYSNKEIMKEKILLAIHTDCNSMNAEEIKSEQGNENAIQEEFYEGDSESIDEMF